MRDNHRAARELQQGVFQRAQGFDIQVDGLRSLGSSVDRKEFQTLLVSLLKENEIDFVHVKESDYDTRFLRCVDLVKQLMGEPG